MEYELLLDDLLESLTNLGFDTNQLNIIEKVDSVEEQEFIIDPRVNKCIYTQNISTTKAETNKNWASAFFLFNYMINFYTVLRMK